MSNKLRHYRCPTCGRLTSVPWEAPVWCLHHNSTFTPHGPESDETDWTVMKPFYPDALEEYRPILANGAIGMVRNTRAEAEAELMVMMEDTHPKWTVAGWIERRTVGTWVRELQAQGDG